MKNQEGLILDIQTMMNNNKEDILAAAHAKLKEKVLAEIDWSANKAIQDAVKDWLDKNIVPEINKMLDDEKEGIVASLKNNLAAVGAEIGLGLLKQAQENMQSDWKRRSALKALFD